MPPQWLIIAALFCTASVLLLSRPTYTFLTSTGVMGSIHMHVGVCCCFFASGFEQSSECALMFRPKLLKATKVASLSEQFVWPRKASQKPSQLMMRWGCGQKWRMKNVERMIDDDETSKKVKEREKGSSFSSYIKLYNCAYSTPLWQCFLRNWKMFLTTFSTSLKGCWIWGWTRGVKWTTPTSTYTHARTDRQQEGSKQRGVSTPAQ